MNTVFGLVLVALAVGAVGYCAVVTGQLIYDALYFLLAKAPAPALFKLGEVVVLRTAGPDMTVSRVRGRKVWCVWFEEGCDKLLRAKFDESQLLLVEDDLTFDLAK